jgi:predicted DNA-binding transcriptional regulator AlpA
VTDKKVIELSSRQNLVFENRFWFIKDVAEYTGYSVRTLYNLTSKNLIPHRKKRGKLYFVPHEIQNWIEEGDVA